MISVICTQCRARLEMDDAFAGGVCRCQYCGTIQTVPSLSKIKRQMSPTGAAAAPAPPAVAPASPRPHASDAPAAPPSGLDALAEAVASSSGLGRGSLRSSGAGTAPVLPAEPLASPDAPVPATPPPVDYARQANQRKRPAWLPVTGAVVAAALLVAFGGLIFSGRQVVSTGGSNLATAPGPGGDPGRTPPLGEEGDGEDAPVPPTPHFCGIDLQAEPSVVYVLDRGSATGDMFDTLKEATFRSIESLKPNQKFAVIFWTNGGEEACYPEAGLADVRPAEIAAARQKFADVYAFGRADPNEAIKMAASLKPSAMVLVTGKAFALEEEVFDLTREALSGSRTKVHTVALGSDDGATVLNRLSKATGGQTRVVTKRQLRGFSE